MACETDDRRSRGLAGRAGARRAWSGCGPPTGRSRRPRCATSWPTAGVALTTVHTVLTRLEQKGFVVHDDGRPRRFRAARQPRGPRRRAHARGARAVRPTGRRCWPGSSAASTPTRRACCASCSPARTTPRADRPPPSPCCPPPRSSLAVLAVLLAWPVPALLARARLAPARPAGGARLLAGDRAGRRPVDHRRAAGARAGAVGALAARGRAGRCSPGSPPRDPVRGDHWVALTLAAVLAFELLGVLVLSWVRTARTRRRHRALLELVVQPSAALPGHPAARAPGAGGVLHPGRAAAAGAVVGHGRRAGRRRSWPPWSRTSGRTCSEHHHLLLLPFVAWEAALPVLPAAARAHAAVRELVEMRADDVALTSLPGPGAAAHAGAGDRRRGRRGRRSGGAGRRPGRHRQRRPAPGSSGCSSPPRRCRPPPGGRRCCRPGCCCSCRRRCWCYRRSDRGATASAAAA